MLSPETADFMIGLVIMLFAGLFAGNLATSLIFRMPRGIKISKDKPFCDTCEAELQPRDLFPFFSWMINRGACRFCGAPVPAVYAMVELMSAVYFIYVYMQFGIGEKAILSLVLGMFWIILLAIHIGHKGKIVNEIAIAVFASAVALRIMLDGTIYGFVKGGYAGLMLGIVIWLLIGIFRQFGRGKFPAYPVIMAMGGVSVGISMFLQYLAISSILFFAILVLRTLLSCTSCEHRCKIQPFMIANQSIFCFVSCIAVLYLVNL